MTTIPGDPAAIEARADTIAAAGLGVDAATTTARAISISDWDGAAEEAYLGHRASVVERATSLAEAYPDPARALGEYAAVLRANQERYTAARETVGALTAQALRVPFPANLPAILRDLGNAHEEALAAVGAVTQAAAGAAARLRAAFPGPTEEGARPWWDPFGWGRDPLATPNVTVGPGVLDADNFDESDLNQGQIGDCFLLVGIQGLLRTSEGDQFLRDHVRWDPATQAYIVTIYDDGTPVDVSVTQIFGGGARNNGQDKPSIASLYEAAFAEHFGRDYLDGGHADEAMERITGHGSDGTGGIWPFNTDRGDARQAIDDGAIAAISSPRGGDHTYDFTVRDADGNESTQSVDIVNKHAYQVEKIEENGDVWIRNPWGPENSADGGALIRVPSDVVDDIFGRIVWNGGVR